MVKKLLLLFLTFAKIGSITFGGGLTMLPLLTREIVEKKKWATEQELLDYYAVGQCTPGIIAVNTATFIGYYQAGVWGGIFATLGMVTPSVIIITIVASVLQNFMDYPIVASALTGINAIVCALLSHTVITLGKKSLVNVVSVVLFIIGIIACFVFDITPILLVIFGGVVGVVYNNANVSLANCVFLGKIVTARNNAVTYVGSIVGVTWKSSLTVTMTNCYHEENYSAIYTAANPDKAYAEAHYAYLVASGNNSVIINDGCATFSIDSAEATVTAMGNAWKYSEHEFPMLKTVVDRFADVNVFASEVQTNEAENSFRLVAGIKGIDIEDYASVSYKIEVVTKHGTLRDNEQSTVVYTGLTVDDTFKSAEDYSADYLYIRKVTGFDSNEKVTVICTPMLTHKDGRVIYGTPDAFVFAFAD